MADIPASPLLRHQWLGSHLTDVPDYWLVNLINQNADDFQQPSQDVLGRNWTFTAMVAKYASTIKPVMTPQLLGALLTHFPDSVQEPDTMAWVLAGLVQSLVWAKSTIDFEATPEVQALFERFRLLSDQEQQMVARTLEQRLLEQTEQDWHKRPDKLAIQWMTHKHALDLLGFGEPKVPQPLAQSLHAVTLMTLWQCAATYETYLTTAGQTQSALERLDGVRVEPNALERTIGQLEALDSPETGIEVRVFRWTLAANLATAIPPKQLPQHPLAQAALSRFLQQLDFVRGHLPYADRKAQGEGVTALGLLARGHLSVLRAGELNKRLESATRTGRGPRM